MSKVYLGIDNGATGTISICVYGEISHFPMPVKKELSYTKKKQYVSRIDISKLKRILEDFLILRDKKGNPDFTKERDIFCLLERPMINPLRFKQSISAARALESVLIVLEDLVIPYQYIDSREWQKMFIPTGILNLKSKKKSTELKRAAVSIAKRLFPKIKTKDADSLLIMEYARRKRL